MKCRFLFIFFSMIVSFFIITAPGYCISDSLLISEIYYNSGAYNGANQWIEIYNTSDQDIDLSTTSVTIESSSQTVWVGGGMSINIDLSSMITTGNSIIKANDYFLIANTVSVEIGSNSITPNMVYEGGRMFNAPNAWTAATSPTRGVRIKVDNEVKDAIMYGIYYDGNGDLIDPINPAQLDVDGFYAGPEPDTEAPVLESVPAQWGFARKVDGQGVPVDTDENNTASDGPSDWNSVALENMTPTAGPEVVLPTVACYSIETATEGVDKGMLVFWEMQNAQNFTIYWKKKINDPWNPVDGDALNDIEVHAAEGMVSFFDKNVDPDMPAGDFNLVGSRYYKCGAQY
ncbi:lamin tail domain-containing protein [bacterium]|nr:lamin tail domain-containing protein [bacterium]